MTQPTVNEMAHLIGVLDHVRKERDASRKERDDALSIVNEIVGILGGRESEYTPAQRVQMLKTERDTLAAEFEKAELTVKDAEIAREKLAGEIAETMFHEQLVAKDVRIAELVKALNEVHANFLRERKVNQEQAVLVKPLLDALSYLRGLLRLHRVYDPGGVDYPSFYLLGQGVSVEKVTEIDAALAPYK